MSLRAGNDDLNIELLLQFSLQASGEKKNLMVNAANCVLLTVTTVPGTLYLELCLSRATTMSSVEIPSRDKMLKAEVSTHTTTNAYRFTLFLAFFQGTALKP